MAIMVCTVGCRDLSDDRGTDAKGRAAVAENELEDLGFALGESDAPVRVVEFSDYGCISCRTFHMETFPLLVRDYIQPGRVHWTYLPIVSGMFVNSLEATVVAECAGAQGRFWQVSQFLYARHADWAGRRDPSPVFAQMAREFGAAIVDPEEFRECVAHDRPLDRIRSAFQYGTRIGVRGTPSFIVDGELVVGARPVSVWKGLLGEPSHGSPTSGSSSTPSPATPARSVLILIVVLFSAGRIADGRAHKEFQEHRQVDGCGRAHP